MQKRQLHYQRGQKIGERFLVHQALMGGMSEVYLCLDEQNMLPYTLKTFQSGSPTLHAILETEMGNWVALGKHPNIVRCFWMEHYDNLPFMVLEWVTGDENRGIGLHNWLRHGPLDLKLALCFTVDIVRGLQHASEKVPGIVHRDLKPSNALVNLSWQAKITDFGLTTVVKYAGLILDEPSGSGALQRCHYVGNVVGTPLYMAPEQWHGEPDLDFRTDLYAVGCILYELLTGQWVYPGPTLGHLRLQHLESPLPAFDGDFSVEIKRILDGCLAKRREDRFERLDLLLTELSQLYELHTSEMLPQVQVEESTSEDCSNRGKTFDYLGQHQRAIDDYDQAIRLNSTSIPAYVNRGISYAELGQHQRAIDDYDQAIRLDPTIVQAYVNRGNSYRELGQHQRAINDYDQAIHLDPTAAPAYSSRGLSYADLGQHGQAINDYNAAIRLDPLYAPAFYNRGNSYKELGQHQRAIDDYDQTIRLDPTTVQAYVNRGTSYGALGQFQRTIKDSDQAISLDPTAAPAYSNRGLGYASLGQHQRAIDDFDKAIHYDPTGSIAYNNRALSYGALGQYERAIEDYDEAIHYDPTYANAYFNKGAVLFNIGRLKESLPCFEKAYELGHQQAANAIRQVRGTLGMPPVQTQIDPNDPQKAFEAFQRVDSSEAMRQVVRQFPILTQMISTIEETVEQQVPPHLKSAFEQQLVWLREIAGRD